MSETLTIRREAGFVKGAVNFYGQAHRWTDLTKSREADPEILNIKGIVNLYLIA
jgi:hypothetical protein